MHLNHMAWAIPLFLLLMGIEYWVARKKGWKYFTFSNSITNLNIGNREIIKNTGFNVGWHWQNAFYWNSPLAAGRVPAYSTVDAQVNYRIPELFSTLKLGATNLLNKKYYQYLGGPSIGGFYYFTIVFDTNVHKK